MAGHIEDRWYRQARDPQTGKPLFNEKGNPIRERSPSLYGKGLRYKVHYYDPEGNERAKSFADRELKKAQDFLTSQQHDVLAGTYIDPDAGKTTFEDYTREVLKGRSKDESTVDDRERKLRVHVFPFMGKKPVGSFNAGVIRNWLGWMDEAERRPSDGYQGQLFDLVSSILEAAVSDEKLRKNPCKDKSINSPSRKERRVTPWSTAKMRTVELALPARSKIVIPLGSGLGLRQGEIFAFSMDNVDREKMVYNCTRQLVTVNGVRKFKLPKGHKTREIPLGRGVLEQLDDYVKNYPPIAISLPWAERDGKKFETINVLMTNHKGGVDTRQAFNKDVWRPAFARAGVDRSPDGEDGMHALRHLFASFMLSQGVSIKELAAFLGHSSEAFTLRTYVHLMPNSFDRARLAVDGMFKPRRPVSTKDGSTKDDAGETA